MNILELCAVFTAVTACAYDVRTSRIPNTLTFGSAALAVLLHCLAPGGSGVAFAVGGLVAGLAIFFPLFALGAMGAGDVKLLAATGAWLGWNAVVFVALYGSVVGGILALLIAVRRRYVRQAYANLKALALYWWVEGIKPFPALTLESSDSVRLPYAVAIAAGLAVTLWQR